LDNYEFRYRKECEKNAIGFKAWLLNNEKSIKNALLLTLCYLRKILAVKKLHMFPTGLRPLNVVLEFVL